MLRKRIAILASTMASSLLLSHFAVWQVQAEATQLRELSAEVPDAVLRSIHLGRVDSNQPVHLTVSLPFRDQGAIEAYATAVSDPKSPVYHHFLTPAEVGTRFGYSQTQIDQVVNYLKGQGFKIGMIAKNHLSIGVDGTIGQAESAFHTQVHRFQTINPNEPGRSNFYSYTSALKLPKAVSGFVQNVSGLENFTKPQARAAMSPSITRTFYNLAPIYNAGQTGQGRTIGISNFDGFRLSNVPLYYAAYGLPTPAGGVGSNITTTVVGTSAGAGTPTGEGDLDIQMVLGMAPLCNFRIYDSTSDLVGVLTAEANDNLCDVISESYGWNLPAATATSAHNVHLSMTAQGITYMAASGDSGTTLEPYSYPDYDPEVLMVGGTLTTFSGTNTRLTETAWSGSGGGWSTNTATFNTLPSWQHGTGVPTGTNKRLVPDVALEAGNSPGAYFFYLNGAVSSAYVGTSFACPVFAGSLGIAEQNIISQGGLPANGAGKQRFGRIQDLFYSQNGRSDVWFDVTSGSNGTLPSGGTSTTTVGWDTVTGWGAINFAAFVATQVTATAPSAPSGLATTGGNGQVALTWTAGTGAASYNVKRATVTGGPYTTIGSATATSYTDSTVTNGTTYYYVVSSVNTAGESANSNQASATPQLAIPAAPTGVSAVGGNAQVAVSWSASAGATSYNVKRATVTGGPYTTVASPTTTSFTDTSVTNGTTYYYVVSAVNPAGESANSTQVAAAPTATTLQQLLLNPGFESGTANWTATAGVLGNTSGQTAHSGTSYAWLDGYGSAHTDTLYQQVAIPSTITTATLAFWLHIDTAETTTTAQNDKLQVQIRNSSNTVLATLATYSNLNKNTGYAQVSFNVIAYKGQTVRVYLTATENSSRQTSFVVDDFTLNVQ